MAFINTDELRLPAIFFQKHKRFDSGLKGSRQYKDYWNREKKRCEEGFISSTGISITGMHYEYLNYSQIEIVKAVENKKQNASGTVDADRYPDFPDFWDEDYKYFWILYIAKHGISIEKLRELEKWFDDVDLPDVHFNIKRFNLIETEENIGGGKHLCWTKPRGMGAPQPINEIVITPNGEKRIGDIKLNDIVYDRQGNETKVIGVFPQGKKQIWELELLDGRKITCADNHLWTVVSKIRNGKPEYKTLQTKELLNKGLYNTINNGKNISYKYKIPKIQPVKFLQKDLPIPPYVLGALLGDGSINGKNIKIASDDLEILERINKDLNNKWNNIYDLVQDSSNNNWLISCIDPYNSDIRFEYNTEKGRTNPLNRELQYLNLKVKCENKFIPQIYKYSSIEQRIDLIKGLMDTDGSVTEQGYCEFTNTSLILIQDLAYILRSLGIYCSIGKNNRTDKKTITSRTGKTCTFNSGENVYRLYIATNINIFHLKRKTDRINVDKFTKNNVPIIKITPLEQYEEHVCIGVNNNEHLYLSKDFIPTHNSWKGSEIPIHRYFHGKANKTFLLAEDKTFLTGDGLYTKFLFKLNFINTYTEFAQPNDYKHESVGMHYRASYHDIISNTERGVMNEVIGESLKDDPEKARGKRGYILWEEAGKFKNLASAYNIAMKSVSQDGAVFATNIVFGTGGLDKENFKDLESMFYDPDSYDMLKFNNIYDKGRINTECCYFTPAFINPRHKDKDGNSNVYEGYKFLESVRLKKSKGTNPQSLAQEKTEKPYSPSEAFLKVTNNFFPAAELQTWKTEIMTSHIKDFGTYGTFDYLGGEVKFKVNMSLTPVKEFNLDKNLNLNGCIVQYEQPYKKNNIIPENLYFICVDPYGGDSQGGGKKSLGVCYVIKNVNNVSQPDNCIVASYISRPDSTDEFYKNLWLLAEYYNAKIAFENDRGDGLLSYFKAKKLLRWLLPEFELGFNENMPKATVKRGFGMHMGSGKDNVRKNQGDKYLDEWLRETRKVLETGEKVYGLNTIYDIGLIDEFSNYGEGNFDRISALRIGMYAIRELDYKDTSKLKNKINKAFDNLRKLQLY